MIERMQPTEDEILDQVCVLVGPFKIPKTVGDVGILFNQMGMSENDAAHRTLLSTFEPYKGNIAILEAKRKEWAGAPHDQIIDSDTRYVASLVIRHLWREVEYEKQAATLAIQPMERQTLRQRIGTLLRNAASF